MARFGSAAWRIDYVKLGYNGVLKYIYLFILIIFLAWVGDSCLVNFLVIRACEYIWDMKFIIISSSSRYLFFGMNLRQLSSGVSGLQKAC